VSFTPVHTDQPACKLDLPRKTGSEVTTARPAQAIGTSQPSYGNVPSLNLTEFVPLVTFNHHYLHQQSQLTEDTIEPSFLFKKLISKHAN